MALQDILKEVDERSSAEREKIQQEFETSKSEIERNLKIQIEGIQAEFSKKTSDDSQRIRRREEDLTELESKRIVERKKNELIGSESENASILMRKIHELVDMNEVLDLMLASCRRKLGDDISVKCSKSNSSFFNGKVKRIIPDLPEDEDGIICSSSDGKRELNLTMGFILADVEERILEEISRKAKVV